MRPDGELAGVSLTALAVAGVRARESLRRDRLFDDPLAAAFVAATASRPPTDGELDESTRRALAALEISVVVRTPFLDEHVLDAATSGCRQLVILGAGLDTRAFRLAWPPGARLFELDTEEVLAFKERVLASVGTAPACERQTFAVDLLDDWPSALRAGGLRDSEPVAWLVEGLLVYLDDAEVERLMERVDRLSAPGSRLVMAGASRALVERWQAGVAGYAAAPHQHIIELWRSGMGEHPTPWLERHGWEAAVTEMREHASALGRPMPAPPDGRPSGWLIAARR